MIIFVSDAFREQYVGGAELTTEAIIEGSFYPCNKVLSSALTIENMQKNKDAYWIFGNFSNVDPSCLVYAIKNLNYSVIEYDYKYCRHRSPKKHIFLEGECRCEKEVNGKLISTFLYNSKVCFWMSKQQLLKYQEKFSFLKKNNNFVLSSVFDEKTLRFFEFIEPPQKNNEWIIMNSPSWIKGRDHAIEYAKKNNLKYDLVWGVDYHDMLGKLSKAQGLIFMPQAGDTCPRLVIEAKLLGCELILNEDVQHKNEKWFENKKSIINYLKERSNVFWHEIEKSLFSNLSSYTHKNTKQNIKFKIVVPFYNADKWIGKCIKSIKRQTYKNFECVLIDDMSTDSSLKTVRKYIEGDKRFSLITNTDKKYALENIVNGIDALCCDDNDVILIVDGDDWLATCYSLSRLSDAYSSQDCWLTYGSYIYNPTGMKGIEPSEYPDSVVKANMYRNDDWRASHLRTFKYFLWRNLNIDLLKDKTGNYYKMAYDQAIMLPLLEMSAERSKYISDTLYVYNKTNPLNVDKIKAKEQYNTAQEIRNKDPLKRIS
jgi:hypothetical protein